MHSIEKQVAINKTLPLFEINFTIPTISRRNVVLNVHSRYQIELRWVGVNERVRGKGGGASSKHYSFFYDFSFLPLENIW